MKYKKNLRGLYKYVYTQAHVYIHTYNFFQPAYEKC